jgi:hypothetical protein
MNETTTRLRFLSATLGPKRAAWILDPLRDPVRLEVMERPAGEVRMRALHRGQAFFLYLDLTGQGRHHCTCADSPVIERRRRPRGLELFCRHVVAAVLKEKRPEMLLALLSRPRAS